MSIEQNTFQQIIKLMPHDMLELIETVGAAAQLNISLNSSKYSKTLIACTMMNHATSILEQCGCTIKTIINNPDWTKPATYETENNDTEKNL